MNRTASLSALLAVLVLSVSCNSTHRFLDAKPADLSSFIEHHDEVQRMPPRSPFHHTWSHRSAALSDAQESRQTIYFAPVEVEGMRRITQALAHREQLGRGRGRPVGKIARHAQSAFPQAFLDSPSPRYRIVEEPGDDSVILELSISELDPTSVNGNVGKKILTHFVGPVAGLAGKFTKGGIAIEGKLRDSKTGELLFQFADRENDKITYLSLRDFRPYSHAYVAIDEWASQFEQLTRSPDWRESMKDASLWTLNPLP